MNYFPSPFAPENSVLRDGFGRPVLRQPAHLHTHAESDAYLRDSSRVPRPRSFMKPPYAIGSVPSVSSHAIASDQRQKKRDAEEADKVEVAPGVTVASLRRFRTALIGPTQGLPKRRRLCR